MVGRAIRFLSGSSWESEGQRRAALQEIERAARETLSPLERLENALHPWISFLVIPLFALANAGVPLELSGVTDPIAVATMLSLFVGKPVGIVLVSWIAVRVGVASLPEGVGWGALTGAGLLAGIGFTMAIFIAGLALDGDALQVAKVGILAGSLLSGVCGVVLLVALLPRPRESSQPPDR